MKGRAYRITARFRIICAWGATALVGVPLSAWLWNVAAIERGYAGACGGEVLVLPFLLLMAACYTCEAIQKERERRDAMPRRKSHQMMATIHHLYYINGRPVSSEKRGRA